MERSEILALIAKSKSELKTTKDQHDQIKAPPGYFSGPMDDRSPWSETGDKMYLLREKIKELTFELGEKVIEEELK